MDRAEPQVNLSAGLDRICVEVQEVQRAAKITQKNLDLERAAVAAADERARCLESQLQEEKAQSLLQQKRADDLNVKLQQTCRELEDEKIARNVAEKRIATLESEIEAGRADIKLEKLRYQGAQERIMHRECQLGLFHATVTTLAKLQQDQFSTMLRTLEDGVSDDNPSNTNVHSTSPCTTYPVNQEIHLGFEVDGSWAVLNPTTVDPNKRRDHWMGAISTTNCEDINCLANHCTTDDAIGSRRTEEYATVNEEMLANGFNSIIDTHFDFEPEVLRGTVRESENEPLRCDTFEREDDDVLLGQGQLPSEEFPMLLMEVVLDLEDPQQDYAHFVVSPWTRILEDSDGNGGLSSPHRELKWQTGEMATVIAGLRASNAKFFTKLLLHTQRALRRRIQLYLPVCFINQYGDRLGDSALLRTQSSTKTWQVRICYFRKRGGSVQAQFFSGWNDFITDNDLKSGDFLIFDLIVEASYFQVYIFRSS